MLQPTLFRGLWTLQVSSQCPQFFEKSPENVFLDAMNDVISRCGHSDRWGLLFCCVVVQVLVLLHVLVVCVLARAVFARTLHTCSALVRSTSLSLSFCGRPAAGSGGTTSSRRPGPLSGYEFTLHQ